MSAHKVVPYGDNPQETATLLLAAADDLKLPVEVVETKTEGFQVPAEVAEKAGLETVDDEAEAEQPDPDPPVKRGGRRTSKKEQADG